MKKLLTVFTILLLAVCFFVSCDNDLTGSISLKYSKAQAKGKVGASAAEAMGRQPEAAAEISYAANVVFKYIDLCNGNEDTLYLAGASTMEAMGRQPEAFPEILTFIINVGQDAIGSDAEYAFDKISGEYTLPKDALAVEEKMYDVFFNDKYVAVLAGYTDDQTPKPLYLTENSKEPSETLTASYVVYRTK